MTAAFIAINIIKLVISVLFIIFLFSFRHKLWASYTRLGLALALCLINIIQLPIEISLEKNIFFTIIVIILWAADAVLYCFDIRSKKRLRKFWQEYETEMKEMDKLLHIDSNPS